MQQDAPDLTQEHLITRFLGFQYYTYSGERTNSRLGTPVANRTTATFLVHLNNIKNIIKKQ